MEYRYLGNSGLSVPILGFGNSAACYETLRGGKDMLTPELEDNYFNYTKLCIDAGITFLDTSEFYGFGVGEMLLGKILKRGGWDRDDLVISTKLSPGMIGMIQGLCKKRIKHGIKDSLKRLDLEYVDLLYFHRPDDQTPVLEYVKAVNEIIENEQAFYWGTSVFSPRELEEIFYICEKYGYIPPITDQCNYSMLEREDVEVNLAPLFDRYGFKASVWSPLARGILTGKYNDGNIPPEGKLGKSPWMKSEYNKWIGTRPDKGVRILQSLKALADELGCTQSQLAIAWALKNPDVSIGIFGVSRESQIADNLGALSVMKKLDNVVLERIEKILDNRPTPPLDYRNFTPRAYRR
ncbi:hypothetical protein SteCoe_19909 [Stentor coeruleus]|uniref:NADP-dependent oxidoreductase domain-containing protein n=1 Tax=Stentor coeruleus TaxID=5963 RepID=A0A1R2BT77_9CILI|nr:hypothetical protein SteCoe_19909 [Stentor coeruleus]